MVITMINVLERITELRESHHWTEYQLAEHSGLTQSTISSWYRKQMLPTIPSLVKICDAWQMYHHGRYIIFTAIHYTL